MNHRKYIILLLSVTLLTTAFFSSCSQETDTYINPADTTVVEPKVADNTLFVFMPYSSSLYSNFQTNIQDMLKGIKANGGLKNDKLMIFIGDNNTTAYLMQAHFKKLVINNSIVDSVILDTLKRYTNPDYQTTAGITSILNEVVSRTPATNYSMIIGSHATGWVSGSTWGKVNNYSWAKGLYSATSDEHVLLTRAFGGSASTYIENSVLSDAIAQSDIKKLRYLLFDDCYMGNMETAYQFKGVTSYLIGSTCEVLGYGMPYEKIWSSLVGTPDYKGICDEYYKFYQTYKVDGELAPYATLAAINCDECDNVATVMKEINGKYVFTNSTSDLQDLDGIYVTIYFDMGDYVKQLCDTDTVLYSKFKTAFAKLVTYSVHTAQYYTDLSTPHTKAINTFSGITISDPSVNAVIATDKRNTLWYKATH